MLAALGIWLYIFFLSGVFGLIALRMSKLFFTSKSEDNNQDDSLPPLAILLISGLGIVTALAQFISLQSATGLLTNLFLTITAFVYLLIDRKFSAKIISPYILSIKNIKLVPLILGIGFVALGLHQLSAITLSADTPLYHALSIKYIENHSVIPGLGNFYHRLAFNNSWFVSCALFSFSFLGKMSLNVMSEFLMIFGGFWMLGGLNNILSGKFVAENWVRLGLIPIFLYSFYFPHIGWSATPSPDVPTAVFTWIIFHRFFEIAKNKKRFELNSEFLLLIISASFLVSIKLSAAVILLLPFVVLALSFKKYKKSVLVAIVVGAFIMTPWLARNYYLSGYLIHPFPAIDLFSPDWKIPKDIALAEKNTIQRWAKWPGWFKKPKNVELEDLEYGQWFEIWLANQTLPGLELSLWATLLSSSAVFLIGIIVLLRQQKRYFVEHGAMTLVFLSLFLSWIYWFWAAPDLRFGWGVHWINLNICLFFIASLLLKKVSLEASTQLTMGISTVSLITLGYLIYAHYEQVSARYKMFASGQVSEHILMPKDYPTSFSLKVVEGKVGDAFYENSIYDAPLPASISSAMIGKAVPRGKSFEDGFKDGGTEK